MRIRHLSFSKIGGAGRIVETLSQSLCDKGIDSTFEYLTNSNIHNNPLRFPKLTLAATADEYLIKRSEFINPISIFRNNHNNFQEDMGISDEVIHLHWTPGYISLDTIKKLLDANKKIIWTLHDIWPFTGGCHYSGDCDGYQYECKSCPAVIKPVQNLIASQYDKKEKMFMNELNKIIFVAPSKWILDKARSSSLLKSSQIELIPNPISIPTNDLTRSTSFRESHGISSNTYVLIFVASDLTDKRKNIQMLFDALREIEESNKGADICVITIGSGRVHYEGDIRLINLGTLPHHDTLIAIMNSDLLVNLSLDENLSTVILEALALSKPVIATNQGGNSELVIDQVSGYLIDKVKDLSVKIAYFVTNRDVSILMGIASKQHFDKNFSLDSVIDKYIKLYTTLD